MMARYIDADKAVECLRDICAPYEESREVKDEAIEIIADFPTADVAEVKHGRFISELVKKCDWRGKTQDYYQPHSCSCCHTPLYGTEKYCSNCGAKMEV